MIRSRWLLLLFAVVVVVVVAGVVVIAAYVKRLRNLTDSLCLVTNPEAHIL